VLITRSVSLTLGLVLLVSSSLQSQQRGVEFGLVGGVNHNTMTGVGPVDAGVAGQAGLFAQFQFSSHVGFRPEMSVSWKRLGTTMNAFPIPVCERGLSCSQSFALDETTSLTWLEVPLLAQVTLPAIGGHVLPRLIAGPYVAVRLACSISSTSGFVYELPPGVEPQGSPVTVSQSCGNASSQSYGNGDAGYILGAGLAMRQFGLGVRWTRSLVATVPFNQNGSSQLTGGKQSTLALTIDIALK